MDAEVKAMTVEAMRSATKHGYTFLALVYKPDEYGRVAEIPCIRNFTGDQQLVAQIFSRAAELFRQCETRKEPVQLGEN